MLKRPPCPTTSSPTHHLVGNHEHSVTIANLAHRVRVVVGCWHNAPRCSNHWLEDEGGHIVSADTKNLLLQLFCAILRHLCSGNANWRPISIHWRKVRCRNKRTFERIPPFLEFR